MLIKMNEKNYNMLKEKISSDDDLKHSIGFLKDSLIGQVLENGENKLLEVIYDDSIQGDRAIFIENEEVIFESYLCDFLNCMIQY